MPPRGNFLTESSLPRYTLGCVSSWGWGWLLTASLTLEGPVTCCADRHPHPNTQDPLLEQGGPLCIPGEGQGPWPGLGSLPDRGLPQRTSLVPLPPANRPPPPRLHRCHTLPGSLCGNFLLHMEEQGPEVTQSHVTAGVELGLKPSWGFPIEGLSFHLLQGGASEIQKFPCRCSAGPDLAGQALWSPGSQRHQPLSGPRAPSQRPSQSPVPRTFPAEAGQGEGRLPVCLRAPPSCGASRAAH